MSSSVATGLLVDEVREQVGKVDVWIDAIELAGLDQ